MAEPRKVLLVGCGRIAQSHIAALADVPSLKWVGAVDTEQSARQRIQSQHSVDTFDWIVEAVKSTQADAAIVAVPPMMHESVVCQLLDLGLHVLCEKPLAPHPLAAKRMAESARRNGRVLQMAAKFRHAADVMRLKQCIDAQEIGAVESFDIVFSGKLKLAELWHANKDVSGGGVIQDNGPHALDLVQYLLGAVSAIGAMTTRNQQPATVEDNALIAVETTHGATGNIELSWSVDRQREDFLRVFGTKSQIFIGWKRSVRIESGIASEFGCGYDKHASFVGVLKSFVAECDGESHVAPTLEEAIRNVELVAACYERLLRPMPLDMAVNQLQAVQLDLPAHEANRS